MLSRTRPGRSPLAPLAFIDPCLPTVRETVPCSSGWVYEVKHDAYRLQVHLREDRVRLYTRAGIDWTERFIGEAVRRTLRHVGHLRLRSGHCGCRWPWPFRP